MVQNPPNMMKVNQIILIDMFSSYVKASLLIQWCLVDLEPLLCMHLGAEKRAST